MIETVAVANYRSLIELVMPTGQLNLVMGLNGCGFSLVWQMIAEARIKDICSLLVNRLPDDSIGNHAPVNEGLPG
ncbi:hypothetical protein M3P05_17030 [Sansalvadorimonas sp. 2012CJ34-2]|uniref:Uncharacterized protein n=1 Tax=Parendozoicomonas callyspongiae TaxID=2942213 RepID=A0ABT0PJS9_9GAMM|nr:hypothetical protein [Sansalvadorimonas sp. 2012CJ34-2]MCL6271623.1 hypothetical protein [Sansalvadorimonas sp. 2012CJ34-2]